MALPVTVFQPHSLTLLEGLSSSTVNVLWALLNLVVGYILFRVGKVWTGDNLALVVFFAGVVAISTVSSVNFAKKQEK
jgi:hypothetical protein